MNGNGSTPQRRLIEVYLFFKNNLKIDTYGRELLLQYIGEVLGKDRDEMKKAINRYIVRYEKRLNGYARRDDFTRAQK